MVMAFTPREEKDMAFGDISNAKEKLVNTNKKIKDRQKRQPETL